MIKEFRRIHFGLLAFDCVSVKYGTFSGTLVRAATLIDYLGRVENDSSPRTLRYEWSEHIEFEKS